MARSSRAMTRGGREGVGVRVRCGTWTARSSRAMTDEADGWPARGRAMTGRGRPRGGRGDGVAAGSIAGSTLRAPSRHPRARPEDPAGWPGRSPAMTEEAAGWPGRGAGVTGRAGAGCTPPCHGRPESRPSRAPRDPPLDGPVEPGHDARERSGGRLGAGHDGWRVGREIGPARGAGVTRSGRPPGTAAPASGITGAPAGARVAPGFAAKRPLSAPAGGHSLVHGEGGES